MKDKILFVGGTWNLNGDRSFKVIDKFRKYLDNAGFYNGVNYNELNTILQITINHDTVIWLANVANGLPKIRNVKEINYKMMLVSSKINDNNKYTFQGLL